jgi:hypothetical protein
VGTAGRIGPLISVGLLILALAVPPAAEISIDPGPGKTFDLVLTGPSPAGSGEFHGSVSFNGSPSELPLAGKAEASGGGLRIAATARYMDVPEDWLGRFRPGSFDYAIRGQVAGGGTVSWSGTMAWSDVPVTGHDLVSRFLKVGSLELIALSEKRTEGHAVLNVTNPFSFPVKIASTSCRIRVNGQEIGDVIGGVGTARARKTIGYEMFFTAEKKRFLDAAGRQWVVGARVPAELSGTLTLRLNSGDASVPLTFSGAMGTGSVKSGGPPGYLPARSVGETQDRTKSGV